MMVLLSTNDMTPATVGHGADAVLKLA